MKVASSHLSEKGLRVKGDRELTATGKDFKLHLDPVGLCWSTADVSDYVLPLIPTLLTAPKEAINFETLRSKYYSSKRIEGVTSVRIITRLEHSVTWSHLRRNGLSALSPDEHAVLRLLFAHSAGSSLVTDSPKEGSREMYVGQRRYYLTRLSGTESSSTLRRVNESTAGLNSYLPKEGIVEINSVSPITGNDLATALDEAEDWCGFKLAKRKPSNSRSEGAFQPR